VVENIQKLRRQLVKPNSKRYNVYSIGNELIHNQFLLNEIIIRLGKN